MKNDDGNATSSYAHEWKPLGQQLVEIAKMKPAAAGSLKEW